MAGEEVIKVGEFRNMALPEKGSTLGREEFFGPGKWVRSATTRTSTTRWLICLLSFPLPPSSSAFPLSLSRKTYIRKRVRLRRMGFRRKRWGFWAGEGEIRDIERSVGSHGFIFLFDLLIFITPHWRPLCASPSPPGPPSTWLRPRRISTAEETPRGERPHSALSQVVVFLLHAVLTCLPIASFPSHYPPLPLLFPFLHSPLLFPFLILPFPQTEWYDVNTDNKLTSLVLIGKICCKWVSKVLDKNVIRHKFWVNYQSV